MPINISFLPALGATFLLVFARAGTMVMLLPGLGEQNVSARLRLTIAIIPHTVKMTNLGSLKPGDPVNIETDIVAKYLEKWTKREDGSALTVDRLVAQGF